LIANQISGGTSMLLTKLGFPAFLIGTLSAYALISGCSSLDQMEAENYRNKCESLGIKSGSPSFDSCILQQQALEEQGIQRSIDRAARSRR